jgi:two-component system CheB/CheR fusion protein
MEKSAKSKEGQQAGIEARRKTEKEVFVIGIGASAGGLQALEAFFSSVPQDSVAYVIVQHVSSEYRSLLTERLAQYSSMEVQEAENEMPVEVNKVYVIPNNKGLTLKDNHLQLLDKTQAGQSKTVDTFFTSLATDKKQRAIGIILSGTGTDGTEGVKAIKKAGGMVLVQEPATAKFDGMPRSAINSGYADHILTPELMPAEIFNYVKVGPIHNDIAEVVNAETEPSFFMILDMVHKRTGIDFKNYRRPTFIRRIKRRMAIMNINILVDYLDYLNLHPEEVETLGKEFLIGVTKFFRDEEAYRVLASTVIPNLIDQKKKDEQLRIWVAGCSTGEEAYSLAILVREYMDKQKKLLEVKIFASDIDREALDIASKGLYPESSMTEMSEERLNDCFVKEEGKYRVCQRVRRMVIFAPYNIINAPPFSRIDLVSCRNMLTYLNPMLQKKVIDRFHSALVVGGYMFLGSSESIGELRGFEEVNKKWKIFRHTVPARSTFSGSSLSRQAPMPPASYFTRGLSAKQLMQHSFNELLNETILDEYGYAAVYINENYDVLHGAGKFKNFLDLPEQNFTFNLLKLVPQDLAVSLGTMLRRAMLGKEKLVAHSVQVRDGKSLRYINIVVKPFLTQKKLYQKFILVLFSEEKPRTPPKAEQVVVFSDNNYDNRVQELEVELQYTKDDLQAVVEELDTANEELQSLKEELHTINAEHQYKIKALTELDDDLNNYFSSTDIGQIFVDRKLIIRKYTPAATRIINLIESDIGRPIYHISANLHYDKLIEDVRHVISSNHVVEREVQDKNNVWYQMRILPYITQERKIDGAILIFVQTKELENLHLLHTGILHSSPNAIIALEAIRNASNDIFDFSLNITNHKAQEFFGSPEGNLIGKTLWKEYPQLLEEDIFERFVQVVETGKMLDVEVPRVKKNRQLWLHIVAVKFDDGLVVTLHDVTDRKLYEQALQQKQEEIETSSERFRILLEAVPHITWTSKPNGENDSFNNSWYEYTGLAKEESAGWGWKKAFHPGDVELLFPSYMASVKAGSVYSAETRILRKADNQYRWHLIKSVPIKNEEGEITSWVGTATDIQDQKDAEEANIRLRLLQQREILNAVLQTQEEERSRISEALHNGLGQVLYAAKLNLDKLSDGKADQEKVKQNIDQFLTQGIQITRDISFELTPATLKEFGLEIAIEEIISRFSSPQLLISSDLSGLEKPMNSTTTLSLYRIIQELLNNIVKHSEATEASVEVIRKNDSILLRVQDNGIGIEKAALDARKGVGLSSIQNRVELLEGKMKIETPRGKGCLVEIKFKV